jgi:hypothetical protein
MSILTSMSFAVSTIYCDLPVNASTTHSPPLVRRDVHALFDKGWVMLIPEQDEVRKYLRRGGKPDFNGDVRRLTLLSGSNARVDTQ